MTEPSCRMEADQLRNSAIGGTDPPTKASLNFVTLTISPQHLEGSFWNSFSCRSFVLTADRRACLAIFANISVGYQVTKAIPTTAGVAFRLCLVAMAIVAACQLRSQYTAPHWYWRHRFAMTFVNRLSRITWITVLLVGLHADDFKQTFISSKLQSGVAPWKITVHLIMLMSVMMAQQCIVYPLPFRQQLGWQVISAILAWWTRGSFICGLQRSGLFQETAKLCSKCQAVVYGILSCLTEFGMLSSDDRMCQSRGGDVLFASCILFLGFVMPLYMCYQVELSFKQRFLASLPDVQLEHDPLFQWRPRLWHHGLLCFACALLCYMLAEFVTGRTLPVNCSIL